MLKQFEDVQYRNDYKLILLYKKMGKNVRLSAYIYFLFSIYKTIPSNRNVVISSSDELNYPLGEIVLWMERKYGKYKMFKTVEAKIS